MTKLRVDVWSDIACPWCYIGKKHLEQALERFEHADDVEIVWRAFELDPLAPRHRDLSQSYAERLGAKYGATESQAQMMIDRIVATGAADGVVFRFDHLQPGNTFDAHRLLHYAHEQGVQDSLKERLLRAYLTEGQPIGDRDVLVALAGDVGLDQDAARVVLETDQFVDEVRHDEALAYELGIPGVPFFVIGGHYGVSGAQPADALLDALELAWDDLEEPLEVYDDGAVCGPDACN